MRIRKVLKIAFLDLGYKDNIYIENRISSIISKIAEGEEKKDSFLDFVKDKTFTHPETKNKVKFQSLPLDTQAEMRVHYKMQMKRMEMQKEEEKYRQMFPPAVKKEMYENDKDGKEFVENKEVREKKISEASGEVKKEGFLKKTVKGLTNAEDFKDFGKAFKNKDKAGMKKALPGMVKGLIKTTLAAGAVGAAAAFGPGIVGGAMSTHLASSSVMSSVGTAAKFIGGGLLSSLQMAYFGEYAQKMKKKIDQGVGRDQPQPQTRRAKKEEDGEDLDLEELASNLSKEIQKNYLKELEKLKDKKNIDKVIKQYIET
jgi:hypothetical protein